MTSLCVNVHKTGLSECVYKLLGYFRKEHLKDEIWENQCYYCYCVNCVIHKVTVV